MGFYISDRKMGENYSRDAVAQWRSQGESQWSLTGVRVRVSAGVKEFGGSVEGPRRESVEFLQAGVRCRVGVREFWWLSGGPEASDGGGLGLREFEVG